jgi:glyoxylase-like metal-dependent hydrolase (beta-lactamase superfamily II)
VSADVAMPSIALGDLELIPLSDGFFALDGGAMFGVVPKPLWERVAPADARNRIRMAMRPLLVRGIRLQPDAPATTLLIDAGCGDKLDAKVAEIYAFDRARHLDHALADAGLTAGDIDVVLASHLHFDHAGGFTARGSEGIVRPRFPRARYIVRAGEWDAATHPNERTRASYLEENLVPLRDVVTFVDEDCEVASGVRVRRTGGHTMHHQIVVIESAGKTAVFMADLVPTAAHVPLAWIMAYDLYPADTLEFKRAFLREAVEREYLVFFEHDPETAAAYLREKNGRIVVERVL